MILIARPLSPDIPPCVPGHRPQLIEARGAPSGVPVGAMRASLWHIECAQCQVATVPHVSKAMTESRWRSADPTHRVPLSDLGRARMAVAATNAA